METVIVGKSSGCKVEDVVLEILKTSSELSSSTISQIMEMLGTELTIQETAKRNLEESSASTYDILEDVLKDWTTRPSTVASLDKLIYVLRKCNLSDTAERIRIKFCMKITKSVVNDATYCCEGKSEPSSFDCGIIKIVCSTNKQSCNEIEAKPLYQTIVINDGWMCPKHPTLHFTISKLLCLLQIISVFSFLLLLIYVLKII